MNPCGVTADTIQAYVDGELGEAEARRLAAHLSDCPQCRAAEAAYRQLAAALDEPLLPPVPAGLRTAVLARVARARRRRAWLQTGVLAAAAALAVGAALLLGGGEATLEPASRLDPAGMWHSTLEALGRMLETHTATAADAVESLPLGWAAGAVAAAAVAIDLLLAWRWRGLARLNNGGTRTAR